MSAYEDLARRKAAQYGLDPDVFVRQIARESAWDPRAVSPAGAQGLAQFMPPTWGDYGRGDPFDPEASLDAGARYMRDLLKRYDGNYELALAAYNAGMGRVDKAGGVPDIPETQAYVAKILGDAPAPATLPPGSLDTYAEGARMPVNDPYMPSPPQEATPPIHPQLQAILAQQKPQGPSVWDALIAFGAAGGQAGWFNRGLANVGNVLAQAPQEMGALEALRASRELYDLDLKRHDYQLKRQQEARARAARQAIVERLRGEGRHSEADALEAELLTNADIGAALGIGGDSGWETRTAGNSIYRVNPKTGEQELMVEGASMDDPTFGTAPNWIRLEDGPNGEEQWATVHINDRGERTYQPLPPGARPQTVEMGDPDLKRRQAEQTKWGQLGPERAQEISDQLAAAESSLTQTRFWLGELESGRYDTDLGPIQGRIKQFFSPDTALAQASAVGRALENLQITNLAPVTEQEMRLIMQMDMNVFRTPEQNKAVLARIVQLRELKAKALREALQRIRAEGYESYILNPVQVDVPAELMQDVDVQETKHLGTTDDGVRKVQVGKHVVEIIP